MKSALLSFAFSLICPLLAHGGEGETNAVKKREAHIVPKVKLTDAEITEFIGNFDQAMAANDLETLNDKLFDWHLCFELVMADLDFSKPFRFGAKIGFIQTARSKLGLFGVISEHIQNDGRYTYLRTKRDDGRTRVLYRLIVPQGGSNYHEYFLTKNDRGEVRAYDVFIYVSGERYTETTRRGFLMSSREPQDSGKKIPEVERLLAKHRNEIAQITEKIREQDPEAALAGYGELPEQLRNEKFTLLLGLQAAQQSGNDDRYKEMIKQFHTMYPDDPTLDMLSIDQYFLERDFEKALAAVDKLDKSLGGDPYLGIMRGNIYVERSEYDKAAESLEKTIQAEPDLQEAYWTRIGVALLKNDHATTLKWLKAIEQQFPGTTSGITDLPNYSEFRRSPQYTEWLREQEI